MNKGGGMGVGSASIVLVFAVLCLTVFSLITFVVANNDKALVETNSRLVVGYYNADAFAERIVAEIAFSDIVPDSIEGIEIKTEWAWYLDGYYAEFSTPISDIKSLYVKMAVSGDTYSVLSWLMYNTDEWEFDSGLNVWDGPGIIIEDGGGIWLGIDGLFDDDDD
jgi:hypothetical protein